jgi:hypothetical protein
MALIKVKLRVVGVYLNAPVELDDKGGTLSVKDVMDAYIASHPIGSLGGLSYTESGGFLDSVSHNYRGVFDFDGNGSVTNPSDGKTLGDNIRPAGIYTLSEQDLANGLSKLVWQYYVVAPNNTLKSKTKRVNGVSMFTPFGMPLTGNEQIKEGDDIIWRLVAIATSPDPIV